MRALIGTGVVFVLACVATAADEKKDEKFDATKLVGRWEPKEPKKGEEFVMEFMKNGKMVVTGTLEGKAQTFEGTYKLDGAKLSFDLQFKAMTVSETITLLKLTHDELEGRDKDGKVEALKRAKPKK